jgi:hypothetical protein
MVMPMGLKIWSLSNPGSNQRPFDHWPTSLPTALTGPKGYYNKVTIQWKFFGYSIWRPLYRFNISNPNNFQVFVDFNFYAKILLAGPFDLD